MSILSLLPVRTFLRPVPLVDTPPASPTTSLLTCYELQTEDLAPLFRKLRSHKPGHLLPDLIHLLECRLENVTFRMGYANNIPQARNLVCNGHILVNRRAASSPQQALWPGDVIHATTKPYDADSVTHLSAKPLPSYLQYLNPSTTDRGVLRSLPTLDHSPLPLELTSPHCPCRRMAADHMFPEDLMPNSRILLANSAHGAIFACQCGAIHVVVGESTLSFSLDEFILMLELHHRAIHGLETNIAAVHELCQTNRAYYSAEHTIH